MPRPSVGLTKITRPRVGYAHPRQHLFDRLHNGQHPVVWVSAPTGAGKTTLAASYTALFKLKTLWYEVDAGDADPASFFHYLGLAAKTVAARAAPNLPHLTPEYGFGLPTYSRRFFEQLYLHLKTPAVLVFDSFQELPPRAPVHQCLAEALAVIPEGIRVIFLSRDDHPAEFTRLRANAAMDCLSWKDLRLTEEEAFGIARNLFHGPDDTLPTETIHEIVRRSDGWAAGLVLMLEVNRTRLTAQPDSDRSRELLFDYFASQLFDGANPDLQQLLLTSALLPSMSAPALAFLTGDARAERQLRELFRRNYFVTRVGDAPAAYEYHAMFREFLLERAGQTWTPERLANLRRRAAQALLDSGQAAAAVELLLQSESWSDAVAEILRLAPELVAQGRFQFLHAWLIVLPEAVLASQPWLHYWLAICWMGPDPARAAQCFESAYQAFQRDHDSAGLYLTFADGIQLAWIAGFDLAAMDLWLDRFEQISADHPEPPAVEIEARVLASLLMGPLLPEIGTRAYPRIARSRAGAPRPGPAPAAAWRSAFESRLAFLRPGGFPFLAAAFERARGNPRLRRPAARSAPPVGHGRSGPRARR
jgi:ATP/maltotriose-dependent transcriptional regulator MalT